jgi:RNA polymerase sigma-70 factor (ECF subfamily)
MNSDQTVRLQGLLDEWLHSRTPEARDRLIRHAFNRLERLARKMRLAFLGRRGPVDTGDVLNEAMVELARSFNDQDFMSQRFFDRDPAPTLRDFFRFAAFKIRRVLIGLIRKHDRRDRLARIVPLASPQGGEDSVADLDPADRESEGPARVVEWAEFHQAVERLPDDEREVFELLWYHELTQEEAAAVVGVNVRTVKRRWKEARLQLHGRLYGEAPSV